MYNPYALIWISAVPIGYTPLTTPSFHSADELDAFRRDQQCVENSHMRWSIDGRLRRVYYCERRGCHYALCALIPPGLSEGDGGEEEDGIIRLYVREAHNHQVRPIATRIEGGPSTRKQTASTEDGYQLVKVVDSRAEMETLRQQMGVHVARLGSEKSYYRCKQQDCPFKVRVDDRSGGKSLKGGVRDVRRECFMIYSRGEHSHGQRCKERRG